MKSTHLTLTMTAMLVGGLWTAAHALENVDGVLRVYPVGTQTCVAAEIALQSGETLTGLTWYHNDDSAAFPKVVLMEGQPGQPPDLTNAAMILREVTGASSAWDQVSLSVPVTSSTNLIYAVFIYPPEGEMTGVGAGGGPGIGILQAEDAPRFFLSYDGLDWVQFDRSHKIAVEPIKAAGKSAGGGVLLSSLTDSIDESEFHLAEVAPPLRTRLYLPRPNPFNPQVLIQFDLRAPSNVTMRVYDIRGRLVRTLLDEPRVAGPHEIVWRGQDGRGKQISSGVYFLRMEADGQVFRDRLTLLR